VGLFACATTDKGVYCWGHKDEAKSTAPVLEDQPRGAIRVEVGAYHACALMSDGEVRCWGRNNWGQLGYRRNGPASPEVAADLGGETKLPAMRSARNVTDIAVQAYWNLVATRDRGMLFWGRSMPFDGASIEEGEAIDSPTASAVEVPKNVVAVSAGYRSGCFITTGGQILCFGANGAGELGAPPYRARFFNPRRVPGIRGARAISSGPVHACALTDDEKVYCWGDNTGGRLGIGHTRVGPVGPTRLSFPQ
jgi:alpha-tubulin suppressor-like RCC1 family protein